MSDIPAAPQGDGAAPEITPEMLDAGIYALSLCDLSNDLSEQIVASVYRAMVRAGAGRRVV
jgi:hypothetical protein